MSDLVAAAGSGDRRLTLEALRDVLAASVEEVQPAQRAPLAKQLADTMRELEGLAKPKGSKVDELADKRAARRATEASGGPSSGVGV